MMVSREGFERSVLAFLGELSGIAGGMTDQKLRQNPLFLEECEETLQLLKEPGISCVEVLRLAVGLVDDFVAEHSAEVFEESYAFFQTQHQESS